MPFTDGGVMKGSLSSTIAQYAAAASFDALPDAVRTRAAQIVLDEMGSACFGVRRPAGELAARYVASSGGPPESRVLGTTLRIAAPSAALANGTAGHADEIDGAHVVGGHPGATLVHAAAAIAEKQHASGAELVTAVVLGYDIGTRLIAACGGLFDMKDRLRLHSDFLHAVAAAVACGRLLGLDPDRLCHAMALATFQANGLCSLFQERRHISKAFCNGQYAVSTPPPACRPLCSPSRASRDATTSSASGTACSMHGVSREAPRRWSAGSARSSP